MTVKKERGMKDMLRINTPQFYISEPGAIEKLAFVTKEVVKADSKKSEEELTDYKAYVVASPKAWDKAGRQVSEQLNAAGAKIIRAEFTGYPSERQAREYAAEAVAAEAAVIVAVGGGRTMDVSKAAGTYSKLPVVTVPTIAATCAPWAAVSILYTDEGDFDRPLPNPRSPQAIVADTEIIAAAPIRYIKAGIADTLAKWYEPHLPDKTSFTTRISQNGASLARDSIVKKSDKVINNLERGIIDDDTVEIIDTIIYLAGFVGSFIGERAFGGFAHPFYHSSRRIPSTRKVLHGELVAFGMVAQLVFEGRTDEVSGLLDILGRLDNLFTLEEIGLTEYDDKKIIADRILAECKGCVADGHSADEIIAAFDRASETVQQYRNNPAEG